MRSEGETTMKTIRSTLCAAALLLGTAGAHAQNSLAPADTADPATKVSTADFAEAAAASDQFEIRSSEIAKERSKSDDVKRFADQMIRDHEKSTKDLKTALGDKPRSGARLMPKQAAMLKQLRNGKASEFDALYVDMQAHSHMEAVALFRTYSGNGDDAKVKAFAKETRPVVEQHLDHVQMMVAGSQ
jgi:putative membrane protein